MQSLITLMRGEELSCLLSEKLELVEPVFSFLSSSPTNCMKLFPDLFKMDLLSANAEKWPQFLTVDAQQVTGRDPGLFDSVICLKYNI